MQSYAFDRTLKSWQLRYPDNQVPDDVIEKLKQLEREIIDRDAYLATLLIGLLVSGTLEAALSVLLPVGGFSLLNALAGRFTSIVFSTAYIADEFDLGSAFVKSRSNYTLDAYCKNLTVDELDEEIEKVKQDKKYYQSPNTTATAYLFGTVLPSTFDIKSLMSYFISAFTGFAMPDFVMQGFANAVAGLTGFTAAALWNVVTMREGPTQEAHPQP